MLIINLDMKNLYKYLLIIPTLAAGIMAQAEVKEGYYDSLSGLNGVALRKAAKNVVRNHTRISYGTSTWDAFKTTDTHFVNGKLCWWDMYSDNDVLVTDGHSSLNIEHSVAKSWWGGSTNDAYCDLFNLNPSNANANSAKSNYPMAEVSNSTWSNGITTVGYAVSGQGGGASRVYEPADEYKGDFARGFMYMFSVYDDLPWLTSTGWMYDASSSDIFKPWALQLLLKWHREDPVSEKEVKRNEAVYKVQGNRNPFIDSPELAEYIWGTHKSLPYEYGGEFIPVDPVDPDDPDNPDTPEDNGDYWQLVEAVSEITQDDSYILVSADELIGMSYTVTANNSVTYFKPTGGMTSTTVSGKKCIKNADIPYEIAVLNFSPSGTNYKAHVASMEGYDKGWLSCEATKKLRLVESANDNGTDFTLTFNDKTANFSFGTLGNVYYNASSPRFTTYTSTGQKATALYRLVKVATSVDNLTIAPAKVSPRIFNLQGMEIKCALNEAPAGVYLVVRAGQPTQKVIVNP